MGTSTQRPRPGTPPELDSPLEILRELLVTNRARLVVAQRIEGERRIVFPETSVIIRDIIKLTLEIERREQAAQAEGEDKPNARPVNTPDFDDMLASLEQM